MFQFHHSKTTDDSSDQEQTQTNPGTIRTTRRAATEEFVWNQKTHKHLKSNQRCFHTWTGVSVSHVKQEHVRNTSGACEEHVRSMSGTCEEHVRNMSGTHQEHVRNTSGACEEHVRNTSGACEEHVRNMWGTRQEHVRASVPVFTFMNHVYLEHVRSSLWSGWFSAVGLCRWSCCSSSSPQWLCCWPCRRRQDVWGSEWLQQRWSFSQRPATTSAAPETSRQTHTVKPRLLWLCQPRLKWREARTRRLVIPERTRVYTNFRRNTGQRDVRDFVSEKGCVRSEPQSVL